MIFNTKIYSTKRWSDLDRNSKFLLFYLFSRANSNKRAFPSVATISEDLSINKKTIRKALKILEKNKNIEQIKKPGRSSDFIIKEFDLEDTKETLPKGDPTQRRPLY